MLQKYGPPLIAFLACGFAYFCVVAFDLRRQLDEQQRDIIDGPVAVYGTNGDLVLQVAGLNRWARRAVTNAWANGETVRFYPERVRSLAAESNAFDRLNFGGKASDYLLTKPVGTTAQTWRVNSDGTAGPVTNKAVAFGAGRPDGYDIGGPLRSNQERPHNVYVGDIYGGIYSTTKLGPSWRVEVPGAPVFYVRGTNDDVPTLVVISTNDNVITAPHLRWWRTEGKP